MLNSVNFDSVGAEVVYRAEFSVFSATVPELASLDGTERAFALFYTRTIGSGAISPVIYGVLDDRIGIHVASFATTLTALAIGRF